MRHSVHRNICIFVLLIAALTFCACDSAGKVKAILPSRTFSGPTSNSAYADLVLHGMRMFGTGADVITAADTPSGSEIGVRNMNTGRYHAIVRDSISIDSFSVSPDQMFAASVPKMPGDQNCVKVWSLKNGKLVSAVRVTPEGARTFANLARILDKERLIIAQAVIDREYHKSYRVYVYDILAASKIWEHQVPSRVMAISLTTDGRAIALGCHDGTIYHVDIDGSHFAIFRCGAEPIMALDFSSDGREIAAGDFVGHAFAITSSTGAVQCSWTSIAPIVAGSLPDIASIAYSPNARLVAIGRFNRRNVEVRDARTGNLVAILGGKASSTLQDSVTAIVFSSKGDVIYAGHLGGMISVYDISSIGT